MTTTDGLRFPVFGERQAGGEERGYQGVLRPPSSGPDEAAPSRVV